MYVDISGVPGIGKTLCVKEVLERIKSEYSDSVIGIYTNALNIKRPIEIFRSIYYHLFQKEGSIDPYKAMYKLSNYVLIKMNCLRGVLRCNLRVIISMQVSLGCIRGVKVIRINKNF